MLVDNIKVYFSQFCPSFISKNLIRSIFRRDYQTEEFTVEGSEFYLKAPKHHFLTGFQSEYVEDKRDRQFIFFFGKYKNLWTAGNDYRGHTITDENDWDGKLDANVKANQAIVGVWSKHWNHKKDRKYVFIKSYFQKRDEVWEW